MAKYESPNRVGIELPGQQTNWYNCPNLTASSSTETVFVPSHNARLTLTYISSYTNCENKNYLHKVIMVDPHVWYTRSCMV